MISARFIKGIGFGLISTCIWGGFYPVSRWLFGADENSQLEPLNFTAVCFILAALCLFPCLCKRETFRQQIQMVREYSWKLWLLSVMGIIGEVTLIFMALKYTTAARGALMANFCPVLTLMISFAVGREALTGNKVSGVIIGVAGLLLAFYSEGNDIFMSSKTTMLGDFLAFCSGLCWAAYTVFGEPFSRKYGGLQACAMMFIMAAITMTIVAWGVNGCICLNFSRNEWLGIIYLGALSYAMGDGLWFKALTYVAPGELGSLGFISAALGIVLSVLCLNERLTFQFCLAILLEVLGTLLIIRTSSSQKG